ncbi:MAG: lysophospholipid acyltransferase family protein [Myxococcota bacterium]
MATETHTLPAQKPERLTDGLSGFERFAVASITALNHNPVTKYLSYLFTRYVSQRWILLVVGRRLQVTGGEHVAKLPSDARILIVANHRTLWDLYVALSVWLTLNDRAWRMYFPVKRTFFYTHPVGWLVNLGISAGGMWPPMSPTLDRRGRTAAGLAELSRLLSEPSTIVGIHPEGTRNKSPDPLNFLNAKGGVGRLVKECDPDVLVLPFYMDGLSDSLKLEFQRGFSAPGPGREPPLRLVYGEPFRAGDLDRESSPKEIARDLLGRVHALGSSLPPAQRDATAWPATKT